MSLVAVLPKSLMIYLVIFLPVGNIFQGQGSTRSTKTLPLWTTYVALWVEVFGRKSDYRPLYYVTGG